jgi:cytochrome bd-type quinol oxidase subunit 2
MIKRRNLLAMVLLMIVTLGIYGVYWYYQTSKELIEATGEKANPVLWTLLLFIPPIHVLSFWFYSQAFGRFSRQGTPAWLIFLLFVFLPFLAWIPVQIELNEAADAKPAVAPAVPA